MREIKFRGKRIDNGEWVYGYLIGDDVIVGNIVEFNDEYFNTEFWYKVSPETVGQYTGATDYKDVEYCEGDHLSARGNISDELEYVGCIVWDKEDARWEVKTIHGRFEYIPDGCIITGNIHESLEELA